MGAATAEGGDTAKADEDKEVEAENKIDRAVLRDIELEVMEMRASMELQGLHRDAIEDICNEKRQRMIEEHEAVLASPKFEKEEEDDDTDSDEEREREQERERKEKEKKRREAEKLKEEKIKAQKEK